MSYSNSFSSHEETGQLFLSFKQFPVDEWNRGATPSRYPNVSLRPSAFSFNFKRNSFQEDASTSENWTLVRNSITSLRPQKSSKRSVRTKGYRESFRKRVCSVDVIYRRSFLINDDDIEKWKNYQAYNVNILQEQPPDVPLRTTSLFCDKEEDKNRSPSVFVPINGPLLLQPSKSFEKKAKKAVKRRNSLSSDFLTKTFEILKKYMNMDSIFGRKKSNTLEKVQNTSSSSSSSTVEWTACQVRQ